MRIGALLTMTVLAGIHSQGAATVPASAPLKGRTDNPKVVIYLLKGNAPFMVVLLRAKMTTTRIFESIGVPIVWRSGEERPSKTEAGASIEMQLDAEAPPQFHPGALAYSMPYGQSGTRIHIFVGRVLDAASSQQLAGHYLGHTMAHEIAHVLQGYSRHSSEGIMKAHWDDQDFYQMVRRLLPFAAEDAELIHASLIRRQQSR